MKTYDAPTFQPTTLPSARLRRRKPRHYREWRTLRQWEMIPSWEVSPAGYLLREAREAAGLSQRCLAIRLGCSQQAVARAERFDSNPTLEFVRSWADAVELDVVLELRRRPRAVQPPCGSAETGNTMTR